MDVYLSLAIQLVSGVIGGLTAGKILKSFSMGAPGNALAGIIGGGAGGWFMGNLELIPATGDLARPDTALTLEIILGSIAAGGVSGGLLVILIGGLLRTFQK